LPGTGKGADWEGNLITLEIYNKKSRTKKFVPVLFKSGDETFIPEPLGGQNCYVLDSEEKYDLLIEQAGAQVLFLPAYSPDLNPIEKMWSKIKEALRSTQARTQPDLLRAIAAAFESVSFRDAMNWFTSCGYSFI
jgi:hypothetical protein